MGNRSTKTWNNYFIMCKGLFLMMEELWEKHKDEYLIKTISTALRNPIVFDNNLTEIIITKHRNGAIGTINILFEPKTLTFDNFVF